MKQENESSSLPSHPQPNKLKHKESKVKYRNQIAPASAKTPAKLSDIVSSKFGNTIFR